MAVGKREWVLERTSSGASASGRDHGAELAQAAGETVVFVGVAGEGLIGWMAFRDVLRDDAAQVVGHLGRLGIGVMLLSGDRASAAASMAQQVSAEHVQGDSGFMR